VRAACFVKDAAETIGRARPSGQADPSGDIVTHGAYVANACAGCHKESLSGGTIPPDWPSAASLTPAPGSALARHASADALARMFESGKRPDGQRHRRGGTVRNAQGDRRGRRRRHLRLSRDPAAEEAG
jgi:hypothetical protein